MKEDKVGILLVDDEPSVRGLARVILEHEGWHVEEACSPEEALNRVKVDGLRPHVAVVDLNLPDNIGSELVDELHRARPESKMIYATGDPARLRRLDGANGPVLSKPFTPSKLVKVVRAALDSMKPVAVLVESGRVYQRLIRSALERERMEIATAASLDEGLNLACQRHAGVLLIPEPKEAGSLKRLLELRLALPGVALIALAAEDGVHGDRWYDWKLTKPYSARAVAHAVRCVMNQSACI